MKRTRMICPAALILALSLPTTGAADDRQERNRGGPHEDLEATIAARQHFFGFENVNPRTGKVDDDKVIITWFSVQSYAVAARGRVFLLDSYIYRVADAPPPGSYAYVPTTVPELVAVKPEAIFIGHGHGDHADNAAYIAVLAGATIFGAAEHCESMRADAMRIFGPGSEVKCTSLTTPASEPGAEVTEIDLLRPDLCVSSFKHVHSGGQGGPNPDFPGVLVNPIRDPRVDTLFPALPPPALDTRTMALSGGGPISMLYQFTVADSDFSFVWHDTNGPVVQVAPQVLEKLNLLPKVDVELGSLVSTGGAVNGVRDIGMYIQAIKPKIFYGGHSDNFNIGASVSYHRALQSQFDVFNIPAAERPDIRGFHDPYDYLRPGLATFDLKNKLWRETPAGKRSAKCR